MSRAGPLWLLVALAGAAACNQSSANSGTRRTDAVSSTSRSAPAPSLYSRDALEELLGALREKSGISPSLLELEILPDTARIQVESSTQPGTVVEYRWQGRRLTGPARVELRGDGKLEENLFPLSDLDLDDIEDLVLKAVETVDPAHGKVARILARRRLPEDTPVGLRVYVKSPTRDGYVDADAEGRITEAP